MVSFRRSRDYDDIIGCPFFFSSTRENKTRRHIDYLHNDSDESNKYLENEEKDNRFVYVRLKPLYKCLTSRKLVGYG